MNVPPKEFIRIMPDVLRGFVTQAFLKAGASEQDAAKIADLLVRTDLRGVFSHGTRQVDGYAEKMLDGAVNPRPNVRLVEESPTTAIFDGDGGLGHIVAHRAAEAAVRKAKEMALGAATSRNHFHIGSAGAYSRLALGADCIGFVVSAHRFRPSPESVVVHATSGSPMSFAIPAGDQPPIVVDMACSVGAQEPLEQAFERIPATFFKTLGLGAVCHALGGFMAGIWLFDRPPGPAVWEGANQGAFIFVVDVARFRPLEDFKKEIDRHIREVRAMKPAPGYARADLPGGMEWEREREWSKTGIPIGAGHQEQLISAAKRLGIPAPF